MEIRLTADIDTTEIAEEIDLCQLAGEIDLDSLAEYVDEDDVAKHIDVNELAAAIDLNDVAQYINLKHLAHFLNADFIAEYTSPSMVADALLAKPDLGEVLYKQVAKHCPMLESPTAMFEAMTEAMCSVAMDACSEDRAAQQCGMIRMLGMISSVARCLDGTMAALRTKISVAELSTPSENDLG